MFKTRGIVFAMGAATTIVTTKELYELVRSGKKVRLPGVSLHDEHLDLLDHDELMQYYYGQSNDDPIVSVEYLGTDTVQCIRIDHDDHLYITDGVMPTHNTSNIVFLKSTDDTMIDTLVKMSGTRHKAYRDSKTVTRNVSELVMRTDDKVSYTTSMKEEPVIPYNVFATLPERNSIVFRAGDYPIWNRNECILPMSWRLFQNTIVQPGRKYSFNTIPTLSTAKDFDIMQNTPNFVEMLALRQSEAMFADTAREIFKEAYGYSEYNITKLDQDVYADEVMDIVDALLIKESGGKMSVHTSDNDVSMQLFDDGDAVMGTSIITEMAENMWENSTDNVELQAEVERNARAAEDLNLKRYAGGQLARSMFVDEMGAINKSDATTEMIIEAYLESKAAFNEDPKFSVDAKTGELRSSTDGIAYIVPYSDADVAAFREAAGDEDSRVFEDEAGAVESLAEGFIGKFKVTDAFIRYLVSLDSWSDIADGAFDAAMAEAFAHSMEPDSQY